MDKKREQRSRSDCIIKNPDYRELIIEMIHNINDVWILEQIYKGIVNITKEG